MTETKNTPLTEVEIESIKQKASKHGSRREKVNCVINEVKEVSEADLDYQKSCVIHVLNNYLEIGPHNDVLAQLSEAFPQA